MLLVPGWNLVMAASTPRRQTPDLPTNRKQPKYGDTTMIFYLVITFVVILVLYLILYISGAFTDYR